MRAREFVKESSSGATVSGGIALVIQPIGEVIHRWQFKKSNKYQNSAPTIKRKQHALG